MNLFAFILLNIFQHSSESWVWFHQFCSSLSHQAKHIYQYFFADIPWPIFSCWESKSKLNQFQLQHETANLKCKPLSRMKRSCYYWIQHQFLWMLIYFGFISYSYYPSLSREPSLDFTSVTDLRSFQNLFHHEYLLTILLSFPFISLFYFVVTKQATLWLPHRASW